MLKQVKISVLMAVYNTDFSYIKRALDSLLIQDFQDFELIIIDDGSNSTIHESLLSYAQKNEDKIVYIRNIIIVVRIHDRFSGRTNQIFLVYFSKTRT